MSLYADISSFPWCCIEATFWDAVIITTVYFFDVAREQNHHSFVDVFDCGLY